MTVTDFPTYTLHTADLPADAYLDAVAKLADEVIAMGEPLRFTVEAYGYFIEETGCEERRSYAEYLLEALMMGVLWRARGHEASLASAAPDGLLRTLVAERRAGRGRRRDGANAGLLQLERPFVPGGPEPTTDDFTTLLDWLLASGEYEDELARLEPWREFLAKHPAPAAVLRSVVSFADQFEDAAARRLGVFTSRVDEFLRDVLPLRGPREDTVQCSRRRAEYHFNMVGAEILNRAWRGEFLACARHVVVLPGCARRRPDRDCAARRSETELHCNGCTPGCTVSAATAAAARAGAHALTVLHGSDFGRFLRAPVLAGGDVGIVGVACVPGLVGAGWRARAQGLPAQCVLLQTSGCAHWRDDARPTTVDANELTRILTREPAPRLPLALRAHSATAVTAALPVRTRAWSGVTAETRPQPH